ncbi:3-isopropylmalate dehydratase large subunit [Pigmentiphaga soli]|uniref:3-isopropylmalate dehydratase large subunit n=2 Tax=Pigmentiphaga soli TaxID=1007095 RepID=A0ABP8GRF0_9BURK
MATSGTLFEKIWRRHVIVEQGDEALLGIDTHFVAEGSFHAFGALAKEGRTVRRPGQVFGSPDHFASTVGRERGLAGIGDPESRELVRYLERNARDYGFEHFGLDDERQGILHVIGPEQGITQPGLTVSCGDSHTATHGALGALAFAVGASQNKQILATQCLWQKRPKTMRIEVDGRPCPGVGAKDVMLAILARIGVAGAVGHVIEYAGTAIRAMSMEQRMTICNMSIEAGARSGIIAPDDTTYQYLAGRPYAPRGRDWDAALAFWRTLPTDDGVRFDREVAIDAGTLEPIVTWGTLPEHALPISASVPDPGAVDDPQRRTQMEAALRYIGLAPGTPLQEVAVDRVFIGSCTNGRIEDLRAAAAVLRGRKAAVPAFVSPGSGLVKRQAEAEGLDRVFIEAGFEWRAPGCSACVAMNGDVVPPGERCAATSNRNFEGRQGKGSRTHLMSPAMAAAAAVTGRLTDVRRLLA